MATQAQMDRLLGKALFDEEFRTFLLQEPERAARKLRYRLTDAQAGRIRRLDAKAIEDLATRFVQETNWEPDTANISFW